MKFLISNEKRRLYANATPIGEFNFTLGAIAIKSIQELRDSVSELKKSWMNNLMEMAKEN